MRSTLGTFGRHNLAAMNLLGMGPMELILIVVLALIVFGPAKLPEIMGQVGKAVNDFRRATSDLSDEFNRTIKAELEETRGIVEETKSVMTEARSSVYEARSSVNSAITSTAAPVRTAAPAEAAPNGISSEAPSNGAVADDAKPPLADTTQWSWETSSSPAPKPAATSTEEPRATADQEQALTPVRDELPAAEVPATEVSDAAGSPESGVAEPGKSTQERAARDDLSPPY
jgi:sec-independent protein translocase protein TatB